MKEKIPESLIHYIWKNQFFRIEDLKCTANQRLEILKPGFANIDAGPDFSQAQILINDQLWIGNVEIHVCSSDWIKHKHQEDPTYDSIILHVVLDHDIEINQLLESNIPTLELKDYIDENILQNYQALSHNNHKIPCSPYLDNLDQIYIEKMLENTGVLRLIKKTEYLAQIHTLTKNSWEESLYILLAKSFGFNTNSIPFERLAQNLPFKILSNHSSKIIEIESLLFGQSGLLPLESKDEYVRLLIEKYNYFKIKYQLKKSEKQTWKFSRMRPLGFPTIRIALFCQLIHRQSQLVSKILKLKKHEELFELLDLEASKYWNQHYQFDKKSKEIKKRLGKSSIYSIIINAIIPFLYFYGSKTGNELLKNRAVYFLENMKSESNRFTKLWSDSGFKCQNAFHSQALLELSKSYCDEERCVDCIIGHQIISA